MATTISPLAKPANATQQGGRLHRRRRQRAEHWRETHVPGAKNLGPENFKARDAGLKGWLDAKLPVESATERQTDPSSQSA